MRSSSKRRRSDPTQSALAGQLGSDRPWLFESEYFSWVACYVDYEGLLKFSDNLKMYFDGWEDMSEYDRNALISFNHCIACIVCIACIACIAHRLASFIPRVQTAHRGCETAAQSGEDRHSLQNAGQLQQELHPGHNALDPPRQHARYSWLLSLTAERKPTSHTLPSLFTIIKKFPTVLFTLENNSDFEESSKTGKISTSFPLI